MADQRGRMGGRALSQVIMIEVWKDIPKTKGFYQVSNMGRVRSVDRKVKHQRYNKKIFYKGRVLATGRKLSKGYPIVVLSLGPKQITKTVHRLVAEAFVPNPQKLPVVMHKDDDPLNAKASNLEWGTNTDNMRDKKCPHCGKHIYKGAYDDSPA